MKIYYYYFIVIILSINFLASCGESLNKERVGAFNTITISALNKTEVIIGDSHLLLSIPANSVSNDILLELNQLMLSSQPESEKLGSNAFSLNSSINTLTKEAIISIPVILDIPENHSVLIAELRNGHWFSMPGTEYNSETKIATAHIYALTTYAVIFRPITKEIYSINETCDTSLSEQTVSFVHVADLHSNFGESEKYSKIKAYYNKVKLENAYTLFTNAGDDYEKGSVAEHRSSGMATVDATKAMQFDVRVIGNHDFAWGKAQLMDFADDPHGVVLASNTLYQASDYLSFPAVEYVEVEIGCMKLGMFSLVASPWNEFDEEYTGDYLEYVRLDFWWNQVARRIIDEHKSEVDLMVLVSHLGIGTDGQLAKYVDGVDIILGGHSHGGNSISSSINKTIILQPEFYADGVTRLDIHYDLVNKQIVDFDYLPVIVDELMETDLFVAAEIDDILTQYAPEAHFELALLESDTSIEGIVEIAAKAAAYSYNSDAVLIDKNLAWPYWSGWKAGGLTQQDIQFAYRQERQKSNTPGFNSLYKMLVTGEKLSLILQAQPEWTYYGIETIDSSEEYSLLLHKASALHPELYFGNNITFNEVEFLSETYVAIDKYARYRTSNCLYLDTENHLPHGTHILSMTC